MRKETTLEKNQRILITLLSGKNVKVIYPDIKTSNEAFISFIKLLDIYNLPYKLMGKTKVSVKNNFALFDHKEK